MPSSRIATFLKRTVLLLKLTMIKESCGCLNPRVVSFEEWISVRMLSSCMHWTHWSGHVICAFQRFLKGDCSLFLKTCIFFIIDFRSSEWPHEVDSRYTCVSKTPNVLAHFKADALKKYFQVQTWQFLYDVSKTQCFSSFQCNLKERNIS